MEELGRFVFESVAHELEDPSQEEECESVRPEAMKEEDTGQKQSDGKQNERDAKSMAGAVDGMLVAGRILRNPLLAAATA